MSLCSVVCHQAVDVELLHRGEVKTVERPTNSPTGCMVLAEPTPCGYAVPSYEPGCPELDFGLQLGQLRDDYYVLSRQCSRTASLSSSGQRSFSSALVSR